MATPPAHRISTTSADAIFRRRWSDWGSRPGGGCSAQDGGTWSVCIGHEHRGGAAMKHFAGLDVSLEETAICVVDEEGRIVREARVPSEPEALVAFLRGLGLALERIGLEACSLTAWLHEGLTAAGLPAVCIETRHAKAAMGAMPNKTDRNDARGDRPDHPHRLVPGGAREEPGLPLLARPAGGTTAGAEQDARRRERPAGAAARGRAQARHARPQGIRRAGPRADRRRPRAVRAGRAAARRSSRP